MSRVAYVDYEIDRPRNGLRRSRNGVLFGVCKGVADHFDLSVFWTRVVAVVALLSTGLWPTAALYLLAALLMRPEPRWY